MEYLFAANIVIFPFEKCFEIIYVINYKLKLTLSSERSVCTGFHNYCVLPAVEVILSPSKCTSLQNGVHTTHFLNAMERHRNDLCSLSSVAEVKQENIRDGKQIQHAR
jgi:hypothetical protein